MSSKEPGKLLLGTQGFAFNDWVGPFYPEGTPKKGFLEAYARHFPTVEIDSTFYGVPQGYYCAGMGRSNPRGVYIFSKISSLDHT